MSTITTKDGVEIYYKDWGEGPAVTFSHGWPLNSDMWDGQMLFLAQNAYESVKAFSETDFTEDLGKFDVPTLLLHGDDDQIVPIHDSSKKTARIIDGAKTVYYPGAPHGITATHQDQVNAELLAFLQS